MLSLLLICGLVFPKAAMIVGAINCVTRPIYIFMYSKGGPEKRVLGAVSGSGPLYALGIATLGKLILSAI